MMNSMLEHGNVFATYLQFLVDADIGALKVSCKTLDTLIRNSNSFGSALCVCSNPTASLPVFSLTSEVIPPPSFAKSKHFTELNESIQFSAASLYLKFVGVQVGWGLFTRALIPRGHEVMAYCGELISTPECKKRHRLHRGEGTYILTAKEHLNEGDHSGTILRTNIDARVYGGLARFINHSCDPNLIVRMFRLQGSPLAVPVFVSNKVIAPDTQLTFHYGGLQPHAAQRTKVMRLSDETTAVTAVTATTDCIDGTSEGIARDVSQSDTPCCCGSEKCQQYLPRDSDDEL